ncbi:MAG: hypothetical protein WA687_02255 [Solirubrobacterales bacterium]
MLDERRTFEPGATADRLGKSSETVEGKDLTALGDPGITGILETD